MNTFTKLRGTLIKLLPRFIMLYVVLILFPASLSAQLVRSAAGANAASIQATVDQFRTDLGGGAANANVAGSFGTGRREINWDGVPDGSSAPNNLPFNFFNVNSPRGAVFTTPGTGFQVSSTAASGTPVEFGNINATYTGLFATFSAQRLFTALGGNITEVTFLFPGTNTPAVVKGFGAVFSDVDIATSTNIQFFDQFGVPLGTFAVPNVAAANETFSFLGVSYPTAVISRVRITSGNAALGAGVNETGGTDLVVMDDFIYGEPVGANTTIRLTTGTTPLSIQTTVDQFRADLGALNPNTAGTFVTGRREINWDGVPNALSAPNALPANFFNVNSPRGVVFNTAGSGFQVSATAASGVPVEFGNINPTYPALFSTFSAERLFTAIGSNITDVNFFIPGSTSQAITRGFGSVFTDVDNSAGTKIEYFDRAGTSLGIYNVPNIAGDQTLSFFGVSYPAPIVGRVQITSGNVALGPNEALAAVDPVVMDDFIYGEPSVAIWFVSQTGNDANDGRTPATAWAHMQFANDNPVVSNSDIINVLAGAYSEQVHISKSLKFFGPNANISPVTNLAGRVPEAVITALSLPQPVSSAIFLAHTPGTSVEIKGFKFLNGSGLTDAHEPRNPTNDITVLFEKNWTDHGFHVFCGTLTKWKTVTIVDNYFTSLDKVPNFSAAVQLFDAPIGAPYAASVNATITDNKIDGTNWRGIQVNNLLSATISRNQINNMPRQGILLEGAMGNTTVSENVVSNTNTIGLTTLGGIHILGSQFTGTVNIINNTVTSSINGFAVQAAELITNTNIHVNNNSFDLTNTNSGVNHNGNPASVVMDVECNWFGAAVNPTGTRALGPVDALPYLVNGTDNSAAIGFQPAGGTCTGARANFGGSDDHIHLYPVPAFNEVKVEFVSPSQNKVEIRIVDKLGRVLQKENTIVTKGVNVIKLDVHTLIRGMYTVIVDDGIKQRHEKMIKE